MKKLLLFLLLLSNLAFAQKRQNSTNIPAAPVTGVTDTSAIPGIRAAVTSLQSVVAAKQAALVAGTNIKTIGGVSPLGAGNIPFPTDAATLNGQPYSFFAAATALATANASILSNSNAIATLQSGFTTANTNIGNNTAAISTNTTSIAANTSAIGVNTTNIANNTASISTHATQIAGKLSASNNLSDLANITTAKANLAIDQVNNTSDANKPVSTAQATAIAGVQTQVTNAQSQLTPVFNKEVIVDYFIPTGFSGDITSYIQTALNSAYNSTLVFTASKTYVVGRVYLPSNIKINFNGAIINPYKTGLGGVDWVFNYESQRINPATGIYGGGSSYSPTAASPTVAENIELFGGIFDGGMSTIGFINIGQSVSNSYIKNLKIYNNRCKNYSRDAIRVFAGTVLNSTSNYIENVLVENNELKFGGAFTGCILSANASLGATSISIKVADGSVLSEKITVGLFFQIGTAQTSTIDATGTATTATIYRCTGFTPGSSPDQGSITIQSGTYDAVNGWIQDNSTPGLRAPVVTGAWLLPLSSVEYLLNCTYPQFNGTSGATNITRNSTSTTENAYALNLYVGLQFGFTQGGPVGVYTISSISGTDGSLTITPALSGSVSGQRLQVYGSYGRSLVFVGDLRNANIKSNKVSYAYEAASLTGVNSPGLTNDRIKNKYNFFDNDFSYCWMVVEAPGTLIVNPFGSDLTNFTLTDGQTSIPVPTPSNYRISTGIDLDANGVNDTILTATGTTDGNITASNSLFVGDIIYFYGVKGRYRITNLTTSAITISRYDTRTMRPISGGIQYGGAAIANYYRVYTPSVGQASGYRTLNFQRNKFSYNTRSSTSGYLISVVGYEVIIEDNELSNSERTALEFNGDKIRVRKNTFKNFVFVAGGKSIPSVTNTGGGVNLRGFGDYAHLAGGDIKFEDNLLEGFQPVGYSSQSGYLLIYESAFSFSPTTDLKIKKNIFKGLTGSLIRSGSLKQISTIYYNAADWDYAEFSGNTIETTSDHSGTGMLGYPYSSNYNIHSNTFTCTYSSPSTVNLFSQPISTELANGASSFPGVVLKNNTFNKTATAHTSGNGLYTWFDDQFLIVASYAAMSAAAVGPVYRRFQVTTDEVQGQSNTLYDYWPGIGIFWVAAIKQ